MVDSRVKYEHRKGTRIRNYYMNTQRGTAVDSKACEALQRDLSFDVAMIDIQHSGKMAKRWDPRV